MHVKVHRLLPPAVILQADTHLPGSFGYFLEEPLEYLSISTNQLERIALKAKGTTNELSHNFILSTEMGLDMDLGSPTSAYLNLSEDTLIVVYEFGYKISPT